MAQTPPTQQDIHTLLTLQQQLQELKQQQLHLRNHIQQIENKIIQHTGPSGLTHIGNHHIKITQSTTYCPLTLTKINEILSKAIKDPNQANKLIQHIKDNRDTKTHTSIKLINKN